MKSDDFIDRFRLFSRFNAVRVQANDVRLYAHWLLEELRHHERAAEIFNEISLRSTEDKKEEKGDLLGSEIKPAQGDVQRLRSAIDGVNLSTAKLVSDLERLRDAALQTADATNRETLSTLDFIEQTLRLSLEHLVLASAFLAGHIDALRIALRRDFDLISRKSSA